MSHNEAKIFLQSIFDFYARTFQYIFDIISDPDKVKVQKNMYLLYVLEITRFVYTTLAPQSTTGRFTS